MKLVEKGQNLWKVIRKVTKDDLKFEGYATSRLDYRYGNVRSGVVSRVVIDWPEGLQVEACLDNARTYSKFAYYDKVKYNGLRSEEKKRDKFSKAVDQAEDRLEEKREELKQQIVDEINERVENIVQRENARLIEQYVRTVMDPSNWNFSDDDDPNDVAKEEKLVNQISDLQAQLEEHREQMRLKRVEFAKKYIVAEVDELELCGKVLGELDKPTALKKLSRRLFR